MKYGEAAVRLTANKDKDIDARVNGAVTPSLRGLRLTDGRLKAHDARQKRRFQVTRFPALLTTGMQPY
jgi:hypothetical protein